MIYTCVYYIFTNLGYRMLLQLMFISIYCISHITGFFLLLTYQTRKDLSVYKYVHDFFCHNHIT